MLDRFTIATFAEQLHQTFRLHPDAAEPGAFLELTLIEVSDLGTASRQLNARAPFSIVFRGPPTPILPQRIYRLEQSAIGSLDVFLVPIGPDTAGMRYEAIFT